MMDSRGLSEERLRKLLGNEQMPEADVTEPVCAEPSPVVDEAEVLYRKSLITITIQLFPHEGDFGQRPVLVIASNDNASPLNRMGKGSDLGSFSGLLLSTLDSLKAELPGREAARKEEEEAKEASRKAGKKTSKNSKGRSGPKQSARSSESRSGKKSRTVARGTIRSSKIARTSGKPNSKQSSPAGPTAAELFSADQQMSAKGEN